MSKFEPASNFFEEDSNYKILPFRFARFQNDKYLMTNLIGESYLINRNKLDAFAKHKLENDDEDYLNLRSKQFVLDSHNQVALELLALKARTKYRKLPEFTGLHIFVVTLRCEHSCPYCQVSRQSEDKAAFDMTPFIADRSLDLVFCSPSKAIKIEFQGGESLLNFELIKYIVSAAEKRNESENRILDFVIATNLAIVDEEMLIFCKAHNIHISTSLDGPKDLHNKNRPRPGRNSYQKTIQGIDLSRKILGSDQVSALMTTTSDSLSRVKDIIDTYVELDFDGIFLRQLSPYGFAIKTKSFGSYNSEAWLEFYKEGLDYILDLNKNGKEFREFFACTILSKILTCDEPGFVDLMNPSGIGIAAIVYNYDGAVYASDESRMLAEMGDKTFKLGSVLENTYEEIILSDNLLNPIEESFTLSVPMCTDCVFEPFCGSDPVYHHAVLSDFVGKKPESGFCKKNMFIFKYLISLMESDSEVKRIFHRWANRK